MKLKDPKEKKVLSQLDLEVEEKELAENTRPIIDGVEMEDEDDTIFYFTNASGNSWSTQWNKHIYTFPANRRTRMAIRGESPENVQNIRKMFATRFATEQYYKTKEFNKRNTPIEGQRPVPYNPTVLQPWIDSCLKPLPKVAPTIPISVESYEDDKFGTSTQPLPDSSAPYDIFRDDPVKTYGEMAVE